MPGRPHVTAPRVQRLHDEIAADYNDMIYAATREEIAARRLIYLLWLTTN